MRSRRRRRSKVRVSAPVLVRRGRHRELQGEVVGKGADETAGRHRGTVSIRPVQRERDRRTTTIHIYIYIHFLSVTSCSARLLVCPSLVVSREIYRVAVDRVCYPTESVRRVCVDSCPRIQRVSRRVSFERVTTLLSVMFLRLTVRSYAT